MCVAYYTCFPRAVFSPSQTNKKNTLYVPVGHGSKTSLEHIRIDISLNSWFDDCCGTVVHRLSCCCPPWNTSQKWSSNHQLVNKGNPSLEPTFQKKDTEKILWKMLAVAMVRKTNTSTWNAQARALDIDWLYLFIIFFCTNDHTHKRHIRMKNLRTHKISLKLPIMCTHRESCYSSNRFLYKRSR